MVDYCLTHWMLEDYIYKPIMGKLFRELRNMIIGYMWIFDLDPSILNSIKDRVRKTSKREKVRNMWLNVRTRQKEKNRKIEEVKMCDVWLKFFTCACGWMYVHVLKMNKIRLEPFKSRTED